MSAFISNFASHIEAMLEWRTSLGHSPRDMTNAMAGFDSFCASRYPDETVLTRELATAWCQDTATGTWGAYRSRAVREFGKYLRLAGVDGFIVPSAWIASSSGFAGKPSGAALSGVLGLSMSGELKARKFGTTWRG